MVKKILNYEVSSGETNMNISLAGVAESDGLYFLALRKPGTSIGESWEFPGGKAEKGETHQQTLIREYMEEFSVKIIVGNRILKSSFRNKNRDFVLYAYNITIMSEIIEMPEHQECGWFSLDQQKNLKMAYSDKIIFKHLENNII